MEIDEKYVKLANYLYNDLDVVERQAMEKEMSEDPELDRLGSLNRKVADYLKAKIQLEEMRSDPMLHEAERLAGELDETGLQVHKRRNLGITWKILLVAASIAAVVVITLFVPVTNPDKLYRDYYELFPASDNIQRGGGAEFNDIISNALRLYKQGAYQPSLGLLESSEETVRSHPELDFYRGLNYMGLGQFESAVAILDQYIAEGNDYMRPEALWYLSLSCLKTGDYGEAGEYLEELAGYDGLYKEKVRSLRKKLRRLK